LATMFTTFVLGADMKEGVDQKDVELPKTAPDWTKVAEGLKNLVNAEDEDVSHLIAVTHIFGYLRRNLKAIYTFGNPLIGNTQFADWTMATLAKQKVPFHRFRNASDIVAEIPIRGWGLFSKLRNITLNLIAPANKRDQLIWDGQGIGDYKAIGDLTTLNYWDTLPFESAVLLSNYLGLLRDLVLSPYRVVKPKPATDPSQPDYWYKMTTEKETLISAFTRLGFVLIGMTYFYDHAPPGYACHIQQLINARERAEIS